MTTTRDPRPPRRRRPHRSWRSSPTPFAKAGTTSTPPPTAQDALRARGGGAYDVALLDLIMPGMGGLELGDRIKAASPDTEVLILTGHADLDSAIQGIKHRVFDYLEKTGLDIARLDRVIKDATERSRLTRANRELQQRVAEMNRRLQALVDVSARLAAEPHQDRVLDTLVARRPRADAVGGQPRPPLRPHPRGRLGHRGRSGRRRGVGEGGAPARGRGSGPGRPRRADSPSSPPWPSRIHATRIAATRCGRACPATSPRPCGWAR